MVKVAVVKTTPKTVYDDIGRLLDHAEYQKHVSKDVATSIKLNLSWSKFYPACSTNPYIFDGLLRKMIADGFDNRSITAVENETVVTNIYAGTHGNNWYPVLKKHRIKFLPLINATYVDVKLPRKTLVLEDTFGEIIAPKEIFNTNIIHLPTIKCCHPETEIFLADGSVQKICEIVDEVHSKNEVVVTDECDVVAKSNHRVISLSKTAEITDKVAGKFWRTPSPSSLIEVKTRTSKHVKVSKRHPFLTPTCWKKAGEIDVGERIAIPRRIHVEGRSQKLPDIPTLNHPNIVTSDIVFVESAKFSCKQQKKIVEDYIHGKTTTEIAKGAGEHVEAIRRILIKYGVNSRRGINWVRVPEYTTDDFWRWMGYFLAEGYTQDSGGTTRFWWTNTNKDLIDDYIHLCETLFGIQVKKKKISYYFDSKILGNFMSDLGLSRPIVSGSKTVPDLLFKCPTSEIQSFISSYFDGDGTCVKDGVHITSKSMKIIQQLQTLLLRIGVISFKREIWSRAKNVPESELNPYYVLDIYGDDVTFFSNSVNLCHKKKAAKLEQFAKRRIEGKRPSNWDTIPINPQIFKKVRCGLGFTQQSTGKASSANNIENGLTVPTRPIVQYFIKIFQKADTDNQFAEEIDMMKRLSSEEIAWDHVVSVDEIECEVPYLYDLSVEETNNFVGNGVILHNTHGHTQMTGALKDSFGLYLTKNRHLAHLKIHEVLVDLLLLQKTISHSEFVLTDGTVMGDGAGPRTMVPKIGNIMIATNDMVAADTVQTRIMGLDQNRVHKLQIATELGLGESNPENIEIVGDFEAWEDLPNHHMSPGKSPVITWNRGFLKFPGMETLLFRSPLMWLPTQLSGLYHDGIWLPLKGKKWVKWFLEETEWGELWDSYSEK
ncbi:MAG: LAGLIDADG family homing endonuclease [Candidatus Thorarchaeota archaeon]|nr:LAGLIDADG family homing endonuclease [Candidatus Thorarchaeota archaeon]